MPFSTAEVRALSEARFDVGWVELPSGIPPAIQDKILAYRQRGLTEVERRSAAVHTFVAASVPPPIRPDWFDKRLAERQKRMDTETQGADRGNASGCNCHCSFCEANDCWNCADSSCQDEACADVQRAYMASRLKHAADVVAQNLS